jgi:hypothetical protein
MAMGFNEDRKRLKGLFDKKIVTGDDTKPALQAALDSLSVEEQWAVEGAGYSLSGIRGAGELTQREVAAAIGMLLEGDFLAQGEGGGQ